jgi:putative hydrolase of the HAD superfamily
VRYPIVLFDVGETLVGPRESFGAVYARVLEPMGIARPVAAWDAALRSAWETLGRDVPPGIDRYRHFDGHERGYWLRFARHAITTAAGHPVDASLGHTAVDALRDAFLSRDAWHVFDDVRPTLDRLRAARVRLGVVSNWDSRLPQVLRLLDLDTYFDDVAASAVEGVEKPAPEIFLRAVRRLGGHPAEALHVGDLEDLDVAGARAAGLAAVLLDRHGGAAPGAQPVRSLTEIPALALGPGVD